MRGRSSTLRPRGVSVRRPAFRLPGLFEREFAHQRGETVAAGLRGGQETVVDQAFEQPFRRAGRQAEQGGRVAHCHRLLVRRGQPAAG